MKLRFTKMQGAGNDFVVLDATRGDLALDQSIIQRLGDRRFGVGADQILVLERARTEGVDFYYRVFNGTSGEEVEHCGNGARCIVRYVREHGLLDRDLVRVETMNNRLELRLQPDGRVCVDMNAPVFELQAVPFDAAGLLSRAQGAFELWPLALAIPLQPGLAVEVAVLSMGNPHAVHRVADVQAFDVAGIGPLLESHPRFAHRVNAGFMEVRSRREVKLRVFERDAGETLACGTGACAAVVAGIRLGWLDTCVDVHTRGGVLTIEWPFEDQGLQAHVLMTGPAETVFEGEISL